MNQPTAYTFQRDFISYSEHPTHDGIRAQVKAAYGRTPIKSIEETGQATRVTFAIKGNVGALKQDTYASLNTAQNADVIDALKAAHAAGTPVDFRIEVQRKRGTPAAAALSSLDATTQTSRCLVSVNGIDCLARDGKPERKTDPSEDARFFDYAEHPDYININATVASAGVDEQRGREIYTRVVQARGADSDAAVAVGAVLAIFGVDVYTPAASEVA